MFSIRTRLMHSLTHTLTVKPRTGGRLSFIYCRCRITLDNGEFLTIQPPSTTTHGLPAIESPAVLTVDEVSYCCDSLRMTTEGHGRESVLGP